MGCKGKHFDCNLNIGLDTLMQLPMIDKERWTETGFINQDFCQQACMQV